MKKHLLLLCAIFILGQQAWAATGDTTVVQANIRQLDATRNFDTTVTFPPGTVTYRKVLMVFTLGKYICPAGSQYCGSWDYIVNNYLMTPSGDTMELSRVITPYATTGDFFPDTWTYDYVFDVTDYVAYLKNSATVRIAYGGYSFGFTANVRFLFIEGTPDRNVVGMQRLWHGQFDYGVVANPITNHVYPMTATVPAGTAITEMKMRITGHGEDGNNCSEFCPNSYDVILNGASITTQNFFKTCGNNPIYAQTGTWPYDRAGWCPGAAVDDIYNPLPTATGTYSVNVTFPSYTTIPSSSGNSTPTYDIEAAAIYYAGPNKTLDASLEEIVAPNNNLAYLRANNICGEPVLHVHNSGSTAITSLHIDYGVVGRGTGNYTWTGNLASLQDEDITLPSIWDLQDSAGLTATRQFTASIITVNGSTDDDASNNSMTSTFIPSALWQTNHIIVKMKTSGVNTYPESWQLLDMSGNVVASRSGTAPKTLYTDTVTLDYACYKLVVSTPDGYGLKFGTYYTGNGSDNGYFQVNKYGGPQVALSNYRGGDFGSGFTQYFKTSQWAAGVTDETVGRELLEAYPNPAQNIVNIELTGIKQVRGKINIVDMLGRVVSETTCTGEHSQVNVSSLQNGVYTLIYIDDAQPGNRLTARLLIAK